MQSFTMALVTILVAFCSIVYELLLAQCLAIVWGNTVVRYSLTIGLYLFSLGMGALVFAYRGKEHSLSLFLQIEAALTGLGILLPFIVLGADQALRLGFLKLGVAHSSWLLWLPSWILMHSVILIIGLLSGAELPILMDLARNDGGEKAAHRILGIDYLGTFLGAIAFPLFIYDRLGIVAGAALTGGLNAVAAFLVLRRFRAYATVSRYCFFGGACLLSLAFVLGEQELRHLLVEFLFG